jgi:hypothetical protein
MNRARGDDRPDLEGRDHQLAERQRVQRQIAEDTCEKHGVFCCPDCFDLVGEDDG